MSEINYQRVNKLAGILSETLDNQAALAALAAALGENPNDALPEKATLRENAQDLALFMARRGKLDELINAVHDRRPDVDLTPVGGPQPGPIVTPGHVAPLKTWLKREAQRSNALPLAPLDPKGRDAAVVSLGQVFINLDAGTIYQWEPVEQGEVRLHRRRSAALAHIHNNRQMILLGDPGSGKSTLLRFLTHCLAQHALAPQDGWRETLNWPEEQTQSATHDPQTAWRETEERQEKAKDNAEQSIQTVKKWWTADAPIPLLLELRDFARTDFNPDSPLAVWQFAADRLEQQGFGNAVPALEKAARQGRVLFLLDGVDEVEPEKRPAVWQAIQALGDGPYLENRWVTTCRILSFAPEEAPTGVLVQTLQLLNEAQIDRFIASWYGVLETAGDRTPEQAANLTRQLQRAVQRCRLQELAENPMLLTIMALVQTYHGTLPDERAKLYQACVETLLLRWQKAKETEGAVLPDVLAALETTQENLERLLWEIAWQAHSQAPQRQQAADIPEDEVIKTARAQLGSYAKAEQFIEYTERRAHLLVGKGGQTERVYTFPHRTFQEYLAACRLAAQRRFPQEAAKLAAQGDTWREVLALAAGTLVFNRNDRERALDGVAEVLPQQTPEREDEGGWYRVWLAAEMMLVVGREAAEQDEVGRETLPRLRRQLAALLEQGKLTAQQRAEAGDALGWLGDERPGVCTLEPATIEIPAGPFLMGSNKNKDPEADSDEESQHPVELPAYRIGKYPVTVAQYACFIDDGGYNNRAYWTEEGWASKEKRGWTEPRYWQDPQWNAPNRPVVGVSWYEAVAYCTWLSEKTGKAYRLPDEAMWEKAARGTDGRIYPWGNEWEPYRLNAENIVGRTTAVGSYPDGRSPYGLEDCSGNVWEWCSSLAPSNTPYPFQVKTYEEDLAARGARSCRGGAFHVSSRLCRTAYRRSSNPGYGNFNFGFRVVEHLSDPAS